MKTPAQPRISRGPGLPLVWLLPVAALIVVGVLMYGEFRNRGPQITIHFPTGAGVEAGKTSLIHKGVAIGMVRDLTLEKDLRGVVVRLQLARDAAAFARAGTQFWIVRPEVTLAGISGLETLIAGVQLDGQPGEGPPAKDFQGLERPPPPQDTSAGRAFLLRADRLGSLSTGAPVYFREIKVGAVETSRLADDAATVLVRVRIHQPYVNLVRTNSVFWNAGGVAFKVSLLGAELKSTSLESLFSGGIGFATPDEGELAPVAADGAQFSLHDEANKEWLKWHARIPIRPTDSEPLEPPPGTGLAPALQR